MVDSAGFMELYGSEDRMEDRPELGEEVEQDDDVLLLGAKPMDAGMGARKAVAQLLVEQVEVADVVLLNKGDRIDEAEMARLHELISAINGYAEVLPCEYGQARALRPTPALARRVCVRSARDARAKRLTGGGSAGGVRVSAGAAAGRRRRAEQRGDGSQVCRGHGPVAAIEGRTKGQRAGPEPRPQPCRGAQPRCRGPRAQSR